MQYSMAGQKWGTWGIDKFSTIGCSNGLWIFSEMVMNIGNKVDNSRKTWTLDCKRYVQVHREKSSTIISTKESPELETVLYSPH